MQARTNGLRQIAVSVLVACTVLASTSFAAAQGVHLAGPILERRNLLFAFTASEQGIAFPVLLDRHRTGLVYFNRASRRTALIEEADANLNQPNLTEDGKALLYMRIRHGSDVRELIACATATWTCQVALRTQDAVSSPQYLDAQTVLYAQSPDRRGHIPANYDFYLLTVGASPERLTHLPFASLASINAAPGRIVFEADGIARNGLIPRTSPSDRINSHIFSLPFDTSTRHIDVPVGQLGPLFPVEGFSIRPTTSADGQYVAFLNARGGGTYIFNLVMAEATGHVLRDIRTTGIGFSRPAFVGHEAVANELLTDRYRVRQFDAATGQPEFLFELKVSEEALLALDRIALKFSE